MQDTLKELEELIAYYGGDLSATIAIKQCIEIFKKNQGGDVMELQEVDTIQDLKVWVQENMPSAEVYEDMYGTIIIRTNLGASMGGYLFERAEAL